MAQFESSWTGSQDLFSDGEFGLFDDEAFFDWNDYLKPRILSGHSNSLSRTGASNVALGSAKIDYKVSPEAFVDFFAHPLSIINDAGNIITPTIPSTFYNVPDLDRISTCGSTDVPDLMYNNTSSSSEDPTTPQHFKDNSTRQIILVMDNMGRSAEPSSPQEQIRMRFFTTEPKRSAKNENDSSTTDAPTIKKGGRKRVSRNSKDQEEYDNHKRSKNANSAQKSRSKSKHQQNILDERRRLLEEQNVSLTNMCFSLTRELSFLQNLVRPHHEAGCADVPLEA